MDEHPTLLTGWGRTAPTAATLVEVPTDELDVADLAGRAGGRGVIARGMGRSYGDPAQNGGGVVVRLRPAERAIDVDAEAGTVTVHAAVSLDALLRDLVPRGWFVPVTPGTRFVTVGGAIASDIHGKNHHVDGTFGQHVLSMRIVLADGSVRRITPADDPALFWATVGGMGLTGIIVEATVRLLPIESSLCLVETTRLPNLDALLESMSTGDDDHRYSVAWLDLLATGDRLGRAVLTRGDHATADDLRAAGHRASADPLRFVPPPTVDVPPGVPNVVPPPAVRLFNEVWYRKAPRHHVGLEGLTSFFHPLDMVGSWNRAYGRHGFLQYQFVVPVERTDALREVIGLVVASGRASIVNVLKRFGTEGDGMLSFPRPGWTFTVDLPAGVPGLDRLLADLDRIVLAAGGRHYLAKDSTATPETIAAGYPRLDEWRAVRRTVDPDGVWVSDQARRLGLR